MLSSEQIENIRRNFETASDKVLTPEAHDAWKPIILLLLNEHPSQQEEREV